MTYNELVNFVTKFKENNIRFVTDTKEIIDYLLEKGIIKKIKIVDRYTFRLKGVMEYFTAIYMLEDDEFLENVLNDNECFLEFATEIEIFAGLNRKNIDLLKKLYDKTKNILNKLNKKYDSNPDNVLKDKIKHSKELVKLITSINIENKLPIALEKQDEILDNIKPVQEFNEDVKVKKTVNFREGYSLDQLEKHVFILARAFRSLTLIDDIKLLDDTFDLVLISYINIVFEFLYEIDFDKEKSEKKIEKKINEVLTLFIPLLTQLIISDAVLHINLRRFLNKKIEELEKNKENNQYKLMILYFMLL